jgi:hypothetical protein
MTSDITRGFINKTKSPVLTQARRSLNARLSWVRFASRLASNIYRFPIVQYYLIALGRFAWQTRSGIIYHACS